MADSSHAPDPKGDIRVRPGRGSATAAPRWAKVFGIIIVILALLFVILHLTGNSLSSHDMSGGAGGITERGPQSRWS